MKITEVQIIPIKPNNGLIAFASVIFEESLYLGSIAIYSRLDGTGYRITYPTKKVINKNIHFYHPINRLTSSVIEKAVIKKAKEILG